MTLVALTTFEAHHFVTWLIIGAIAGALAGRVMRGAGFGLIGDIAIGLLGALVGGVILHVITGSDETASFLGECAVAFAGALIVVWLLHLASPRRGY